jgi:chromosome segregation ATPase
MRRLLLVCGLLLCCAPARPGLAQENPLVQEAQRQEAEERARRLQARVDDLEATIQTFQQRFTALAEEMSRLRTELQRVKEASSRDTGVQENLKHLADKINEVDKNRRSDNEKVLSQLSDLKRSLLEGAAPRSRSSPPPAPPPPSGSDKGYEYSIQKNDNLTKIVTALNRQGIKVTSKQVMDANPGVKWNSLRVGQKIFIPAPE